MVAPGKSLRMHAQPPERAVPELFFQEGEVADHRGGVIRARAEVETALEPLRAVAKSRGDSKDAAVVPPDRRRAREGEAEEGAGLEKRIERQQRADGVARDYPVGLAQGIPPSELGPERTRQKFEESVRSAARGFLWRGGRSVVAPAEIPPMTPVQSLGVVR